MELPATVTLIEEDAGRFFSTREAGVCWTDVEYQTPIADDDAGNGNQYAIGGILYCIAPLAELNGSGSVTIGDMTFSGRVDWQPPQ
jgi:hypothetical protein